MTKKKFIVCVFLFFFINHVFSQFTCTVKEGKLKSIDISLSLFKNKMYLIVLQRTGLLAIAWCVRFRSSTRTKPMRVNNFLNALSAS